MSWGAVIVGGAALGGALISSSAADRASGRASAAANDANAVNARLAQISEEEWNLYNRDAVPMLRELTMRRTTPDRTAEEVGLAAGDVKDQYAAARQNTMRALSFARNPADPGYADVMARSYGDEAGAVGRAMTEARRAERARKENTDWNRTLQAIQGYQRLPQDVSANLNAASAGYGRSGALHADIAGMNSRAAGQAGYAAAYLGSDVARRWYRSPTSNPGSSDLSQPDFSAGYYGPGAEDYNVGYPSGGVYEAKEGGAITRRGVRRAIPNRALRRRTLEHRPYAMRYDDGGFVDQPSLDFIRNGRVRAAYDLTDQQKAALVGTPYANAPAYTQQEAVASRMLAGDPRFAPETEQQRSFLNMLQQFRTSGDAGYMHRDWVYDPSWDEHLASAAGSAPSMPGTGQMDSDWLRAEAERMYTGGQGAMTPNFRLQLPPASVVSVGSGDPYNISSGGGGVDASAGDASSGDAGGGDAGGGDSGGGGDGGGGGEADGGPIRGPGTGTSDSIRTKVREGSYILSADTVRAIGESKIQKLMEQAGIRPGLGGRERKGVPVRLSNGEYEIPPEVVAHHGEEFFNKMQQKYHRPVQTDEFGIANGGAIRRRALPRMVEDAIFRSIPSRAIGRRG